MRNLLLVSAVLFAACSTTAPVVTLEDLVPMAFEEGLVIEIPCPVHGTHPNRLVSTRVVRLYEFVDDQGRIVEAPEEQIRQIMDMIAFNRALENTVITIPLTPLGPLPEED